MIYIPHNIVQRTQVEMKMLNLILQTMSYTTVFVTFIHILLKCVPNDPVVNKSLGVHVMFGHRRDTPIKPMIT